jgi:hypothetical protein
MCEVIDLFTRREWKRPGALGRKRPASAARVGRLAAVVNDEAAYVTRRFGDWTQIGIPADHVVRRLTR